MHLQFVLQIDLGPAKNRFQIHIYFFKQPFFSFPPDTSGMVFDTNLKMVMSQGGTFERMKEKVRTANDFSLGITFQLI